MITAGVLITLIACSTIVYLGHLMHKFYIQKADEAFGLLMGDVELLKAGQTSLENRQDTAENQIKELKRAATNANLSKLR